ncbi:MAG TPA: glucokinase [Candidatus Cybelea sp.]|nr:glucokinase [Candidatus Cybelea sp.]
MSRDQTSRQGPALVADIGGTNARFAVADLSGPVPQVPQFETFACARFRSLPEAAAAYVAKAGVRPAHAAFAVAGPITGDRATITNLRWTMTVDELRAATGAETVLLVNDFVAQALAVPMLVGKDLRQLGGTMPVERATKAVVGPGTGLGIGGIVWSASRWMPIPGEGGHADFAAETQEEMALLAPIHAGLGHFSNERVLSGPGLVNLYAAFAAHRGVKAPVLEASEVTRRGLANEDPIAVAALDFFVRALGRVAGDTALTLGAQGGVYLGGGIPPKIQDALDGPTFRDAFESKGRLSAFVKPIPVYVVLARDAGLRGAAAALMAAVA